ncbi:MAG: SCO family protein [Gammaproteobacteria bacterium]|nr:SCO family protein [Gammaproteobacteria bacterium]
MRRLLLVAAWLLSVGAALAQESVFDYENALATSQAVIGGPVGQHEFVTAEGDRISLVELRGKPLVISMVYTSCYQICPMTTRYLADVIDKARDALGDTSFNVALVGFDSPMDTPAAMAYFGDRQGVGDDGWYLLSGTPAAVDALARQTGFLFYPSPSGFDHLIQATIVDADGIVYRQVYGQVFDTPLLVDPLIELVLGRAPPEQPLLDNLVARIKLFCTTYDPATDGYYFDYSLFVGMAIGFIIIALTGNFVVRSWWHH